MLSKHLVEQIARVCYAAATTWDESHGADPAPAWEDADEATVQSLTKRINVTLADPRGGDGTYHNTWVAEMRENGWCAGSDYDAKRKIDPQMVQFHMLTPFQKARERMFRSIIIALSRV